VMSVIHSASGPSTAKLRSTRSATTAALRARDGAGGLEGPQAPLCASAARPGCGRRRCRAPAPARRGRAGRRRWREVAWICRMICVSQAWRISCAEAGG
jgi:hypothetical protein